MYLDAFSEFPVIETERLVLRRLEERDADDIYEYAVFQEDFKYTDGFPAEYEEVKAMINIWRNEAYESKRFIRWAIELKAEHKVIGGIYMFDPEGDDICGRKVEIGYEISPKYKSRGFASESIRAVGQYAVKNMGIVRVQVLIMPENIASVRACEKAGFVKEGVLRNFRHYKKTGNEFRTMAAFSLTPEDIQ